MLSLEGWPAQQSTLQSHDLLGGRRGGDRVERQRAPIHEFEARPLSREYLVDVGLSASCLVCMKHVQSGFVEVGPSTPRQPPLSPPPPRRLSPGGGYRPPQDKLSTVGIRC